jgi:MFS family permease
MLMIPLEEEFGWSRTGMGLAIGVNILLYGLIAPFAAALMERFGIRIVTTVALGAHFAGNVREHVRRD